MTKIRSTFGIGLTFFSVLALVQSMREFAMWEVSGRHFDAASVTDRNAAAIGGVSVGIVDDQPTDSLPSETPYDGRIAILVNGDTIGASSRAEVRRGRADLGRYHLWADVWLFRDRTSGERSLWVSRRIQESPEGPTRYEVILVDSAGTVRRELLRGWQLARSYPHFRSTQFVRTGAWTVFPLSMLEAAYAWPILLVFPLGSLILGIILLRGSRRRALKVAH